MMADEKNVYNNIKKHALVNTKLETIPLLKTWFCGTSEVRM